MQPPSTAIPGSCHRAAGAVGGASAGGERGFDWSALVPYLVHPTKVMIVEAMHWIERPLSARELELLFNGRPDLSSLSHHIRQLVKAGVLVEVGSRQVRGAVQHFYFFCRRWDSGAR